MDRVEIFEVEEKIGFSVFEENPLLIVRDGKEFKLFISNPKHIQIKHVEDMKTSLEGSFSHPSTEKQQSTQVGSWIKLSNVIFS